MIMFCLHPAHRDVHGPEEISGRDALAIIEGLVKDGLTVRTTTFEDRDGTPVVIFWSVDASGGVGTVWQHTFSAVTFNVPAPDIAVRSVILEMNDVSTLSPIRRAPVTEYAVGE